jgi:amino acid transporter
MSFKRSLGFFSLMFTAVSGILGSGWLLAPFFVSKIAGPAALFAWIGGALIMFFISLTFAELVCMKPLVGANVRYIHATHGKLCGFVFSWILYLGYVAVAPVETMAVVNYLSSFWPHLIYNVHDVNVLTRSGLAVSVITLFILCCLNLLSIRWFSRINNVIVYFKIIVPILVAIFLFSVGFESSNFTMGGFEPAGFNSVVRAISYGGIIFSFAGYAPVIVLAGEARGARKMIPLVLGLTFSLCLVIYLLVQSAFIGALDPSSIAKGWASLHFSGDASPFTTLLKAHHLQDLNPLVYVVAVLAPLGTAAIFIATSSRIAFAMSENGVFPHFFLRLSKNSVPARAVLLNFFLGLIIFLPNAGWQSVVGFLVSAFVIGYLIGPICLFVLRKKMPEVNRPFKVPFYPLFCYCAFYCANLVIFWAGFAIFKKILVSVILGVILLLIHLCFKTQKKDRGLDIKESIWLFFYFIGFGVLSYLSTFEGGIGVIKFGWDFLAIALFSLVFFIFAIRSHVAPEKIMRIMNNT